MERLTKVDDQGRLLAYSISDTGLPIIVMKGNPYRELIERLKAYEDTGLEPEEIKKMNFCGCYFEELYELCNKVYTKKPEVKNFNEYVKSLILKDLEQN